MPNAIFELDTIKDLPLWAQVLMASRMVRRAVLALPPGVPESGPRILLAGCDAMDQCAKAGQNLRSEKAAIGRAERFQPSTITHAAALAMECAADATLAAEASLDFGAAEVACVNSAQRAMTHASESPGLAPLQAQIFMAADLDLLRFACKEARVGRYDGLGEAVFGRMTPVHPPEPHKPNQADADPTGGAR
jgi:hypothetical protein